VHTPGDRPASEQRGTGLSFCNKFQWLLWASVLTLSACHATPKAAVVHHPKREAQALVEGLGGDGSCRDDRDCRFERAEGACVLGTCFGLLTADNSAVRHLLADRLQHSAPAIRAAAKKRLLSVLSQGDAGPDVRLAAVEGLGAVLAGEGKSAKFSCDDVCLALRSAMAATDPPLSAAARLALGRAGDPTVIDALLEDLDQGTELLRSEAARALGRELAWRVDPRVVSALVQHLSDASPVVVLSALHALTPVAHQPAVRQALTALRARSPHLGYDIDRILGTPPARRATP